MFKCLINYNFTPDPTWIGGDYIIYDRSDDGVDHLKDFDPSKIIKRENFGNVDFDKLTYLVDNYYNLPEVFLWSKSNLFKYVSPEEYDIIKDNKHFTPLLTKNHKTYSDAQGVVCYYGEGGLYYERNDSWYLSQHPAKYFANYHEFARRFRLPDPLYIPFPPGGNFILTRETVHKYSRDYYDELRSVLPYATLPGEAHMMERSYYNIWK